MTNWDIARDRIVKSADWMCRGVEDAEVRLERATTASAAFAAEVYRFVEDPEGVGTDALRGAYDEFMARHAAGFNG